MAEVNWPAYYQAVAGAEPRAPLRLALDQFGSHAGFAVDLGCGSGTDTVELLRRGWRVLAIDGQAHAIELLLQRDLPHPDRLETRVSPLQDAAWPTADLVNASLVLPFLPPSAFANVWQRILQSLRPGSRFAGHFFGNRDAWASRPDRTHHTHAQVVDLVASLSVELLEEREWDGQTATGEPKHWHLFEVVARGS